MRNVSSTRRKLRVMSEINVVPYIDVMLVLLVIFMITTPLLSPGVDVNLPKAGGKPLPVKAEAPIIVTVDAKGTVYLTRGAESTFFDTPEQLAARLSAIRSASGSTKSERPVFIRGDTRLAYGKMMSVLTQLQRAGITQVGLVAEPTGQADDVFTT